MFRDELTKLKGRMTACPGKLEDGMTACPGKLIMVTGRSLSS